MLGTNHLEALLPQLLDGCRDKSSVTAREGHVTLLHYLPATLVRALLPATCAIGPECMTGAACRCLQRPPSCRSVVQLCHGTMIRTKRTRRRTHKEHEPYITLKTIHSTTWHPAGGPVPALPGPCAARHPGRAVRRGRGRARRRAASRCGRWGLKAWC